MKGGGTLHDRPLAMVALSARRIAFAASIPVIAARSMKNPRARDLHLAPVACEHHVGAARVAHRRRTLMVAQSEQREAGDVTKHAALLPGRGARRAPRPGNRRRGPRALARKCRRRRARRGYRCCRCGTPGRGRQRGELLLHRVEHEEVVELVVAREDAAVGPRHLGRPASVENRMRRTNDGRGAKERIPSVEPFSASSRGRALQ